MHFCNSEERHSQREVEEVGQNFQFRAPEKAGRQYS